MRRDSNDLEWKKVKFEVRKRDQETCRLIKIVSVSEMFLLKKKAGRLLQILDPAHIIPVSERPDLCYNSDNIVTLNRYSHEMLDNFKHPITGTPINKQEVLAWWKKIAKEKQWNNLVNLMNGRKNNE